MRRFYPDGKPRFVALVRTVVLAVFLTFGWGLPRAFADPTPETESPPSASVPSAASGAAASASAAPAPAGSAASVASAELRVRDKTVVILRAARAGYTPADRARAANTAIEALLAKPDEVGDTRFEESQGTAVIYVAKTPILTLGPEDVEASGEASLSVLAAQVSTRLGDAINTERKRSAIAKTVFSLSLLVFSALLAFLLLGRASELATRLRTSFTDDPERVTAVRLGKIEFVSAGAARGALSIALTIGYRIIQIAIAYGWLIFGLSLFEATHGYTERLTGMVIKPLYALAERIGTSLPLLVIAAIAVFAVSVLVRFIGLFFDSVGRGDTRIGWLARDLAKPVSALVRFGVIVIALVLGSPLITGETDGAVSRVGLVALLAVALACTPLAASVAVGVSVVFGRRIKRGEYVEIGGRSGRVLDVTLLDVRLEDEALSEVSVPHILGLYHPMRVHRHAPLSTLDVVVDGAAPQDAVEKALFEAARTLSARGRVDLVYIDGVGAHWRVTSAAMRNEISLAKAVQDALASIGVDLGRVPGAHRPSAKVSSGAKDT